MATTPRNISGTGDTRQTARNLKLIGEKSGTNRNAKALFSLNVIQKMTKAIITTHQVFLTKDGQDIEAIVTLDEGEIISGMFLHIPLNRMIDATIPIREVISGEENRVRMILDCDKDAEMAEIFMAFDFENETLLVSDNEEN